MAPSTTSHTRSTLSVCTVPFLQTALVTEGCGLLGRRLEKHPRTIAALISRIVPWRTPVGVMVNATLSAASDVVEVRE